MFIVPIRTRYAFFSHRALNVFDTSNFQGGYLVYCDRRESYRAVLNFKEERKELYRSCITSSTTNPRLLHF